MPLTTAGRNFIANAIINEGPPTFFDNATARLAVGDSTDVFSAAHTDLQAATNKFRKGMDPTFPTIATNVITFRSTFATGEANFVWNEWGVFNAASGGVMLNRKQENLGEKSSSQSWELSAEITISIG